MDEEIITGEKRQAICRLAQVLRNFVSAEESDERYNVADYLLDDLPSCEEERRMFNVDQTYLDRFGKQFEEGLARKQAVGIDTSKYKWPKTIKELRARYN